MKRQSCALFTSALMILAVTVTPVRALTPVEKPAQEAAKSWLALTDSGKYAQSWERAAQAFKTAVTKDLWVRALQSVRAPLGRLKSRKLISAKSTKTLPGAADGEYVVIQYQSVFEKKTSAIETVTPMRESNGTWRVSGYLIK